MKLPYLESCFPWLEELAAEVSLFGEDVTSRHAGLRVPA